MFILNLWASMPEALTEKRSAIAYLPPSLMAVMRIPNLYLSSWAEVLYMMVFSESLDISPSMPTEF
jgi:hypothetical protein